MASKKASRSCPVAATMLSRQRLRGQRPGGDDGRPIGGERVDPLADDGDVGVRRQSTLDLGAETRRGPPPSPSPRAPARLSPARMIRLSSRRISWWSSPTAFFVVVIRAEASWNRRVRPGRRSGAPASCRRCRAFRTGARLKPRWAKLPGGFASGEPAADDVDVVGHCRIALEPRSTIVQGLSAGGTRRMPQTRPERTPTLCCCSACWRGSAISSSRTSAIGGAWLMLWKGSGGRLPRGLCRHAGTGSDGALIATVMRFGATGRCRARDHLSWSARRLRVGHLVAIRLYLRNLPSDRAGQPDARGTGPAVLTPLIAALITSRRITGRSRRRMLVFSARWLRPPGSSRFPRYRVGLGAVLFVVSDLVIFAREAGWLARDRTAG